MAAAAAAARAFQTIRNGQLSRTAGCDEEGQVQVLDKLNSFGLLKVSPL